MKPHPKACWCVECKPAKIAAFRATYLERVKLMSVIRPPATKDALVPVRAHFRRQPNYCSRKPELRKIAFELSLPYRGEK